MRYKARETKAKQLNTEERKTKAGTNLKAVRTKNNKPGP